MCLSRPAALVALLVALLLAAVPAAAVAQAPVDGWPGDDEEQAWWPGDDDGDGDDASDDGPWPGGTLPEPVVPVPGPSVPVGDVDPGGTPPTEVTPPPAEDPWVPEEIEVPTTTRETVAGRVAMMRPNGKAAIPRGAPKRVRQIIAAANRIVGKPYKWGGGHARLEDRGYDCSGTVSYALIRAGLLRSPLVSGAFARRYAGGPGRYVSIYANKGHVYMEVAGLRLDTSAVSDRGGRKGVRWRPVIGKRKGFSTRHPVGL